MDGVHSRIVEGSLAKARTAAAFRRPGRDFAMGLAEGPAVLLALPGCLPAAGAVPVRIGGEEAGAVGVNAGTSIMPRSTTVSGMCRSVIAGGRRLSPSGHTMAVRLATPLKTT